MLTLGVTALHTVVHILVKATNGDRRLVAGAFVRETPRYPGRRRQVKQYQSRNWYSRELGNRQVDMRKAQVWSLTLTGWRASKQKTGSFFFHGSQPTCRITKQDVNWIKLALTSGSKNCSFQNIRRYRWNNSADWHHGFERESIAPGFGAISASISSRARMLLLRKSCLWVSSQANIRVPQPSALPARLVILFKSSGSHFYSDYIDGLMGVWRAITKDDFCSIILTQKSFALCAMSLLMASLHSSLLYKSICIEDAVSPFPRYSSKRFRTSLN